MHILSIFIKHNYAGVVGCSLSTDNSLLNTSLISIKTGMGKNRKSNSLRCETTAALKNWSEFPLMQRRVQLFVFFAALTEKFDDF